MTGGHTVESALVVLRGATWSDGTGPVLLHEAGDAEVFGKIVAKPLGTNAASVLRVYRRRATDEASTLIAELALPAVTKSPITGIWHAAWPPESPPQSPMEVVLPLDCALDRGDQILVSLGIAVAGGWQIEKAGATTGELDADGNVIAVNGVPVSGFDAALKAQGFVSTVPGAHVTVELGGDGNFIAVNGVPVSG